MLFVVVAVQKHTGVVAKSVVGLVWRQFANRQMDSNQNAPTSVTVDKSTQAHAIPTSESWQIACSKHANALLPSQQLTLEPMQLRTMHQHTTFWRCSQQAQTFNKSIAQNSTISKSFGAQVAKHTVLQQKKTVGTVQPFCFAFYASLSCASKVSRSMPCTIAACSTVSW